MKIGGWRLSDTGTMPLFGPLGTTVEAIAAYGPRREDAMERANVMCPNMSCRKVFAVPADLRGQIITCAHCKTQLRVPKPPLKKSA